MRTSRFNYQQGHFERLIDNARTIEPIAYAAVWPCEAHALEGTIEASREGLLSPILIGDADAIRATAKEISVNLGGIRIEHAATPEKAVACALELAASGEIHGIMKGSLHTDILMHGVISPESYLRTDRRISHTFMIDVEGQPNLVFVTDAAVNIHPDLEIKRDIIQNAIDLHVGLGLGVPRVAILSAVEVINPKITSTIDAACLCKMADRGQITGGILDGPLAMDNAVSIDAAKIKDIVSPVAGRAQILVAPDMESANILAKNMIFMGGSASAGLVLGAKIPILLTSRADNTQARLASAAAGAVYAHYLKTGSIMI